MRLKEFKGVVGRGRVMSSARQQRPITSFARSTVFAEFRFRDARALDHNGFKDRAPHEKPPLPPPPWRRETDERPGNWAGCLAG